MQNKIQHTFHHISPQSSKSPISALRPPQDTKHFLSFKVWFFTQISFCGSQMANSWKIGMYFVYCFVFTWPLCKAHGLHVHSFRTFSRYFWVWHSSLSWRRHSFWWSGSCSKLSVPVIFFKPLIPYNPGPNVVYCSSVWIKTLKFWLLTSGPKAPLSLWLKWYGLGSKRRRRPFELPDFVEYCFSSLLSSV